MKKNETRAWKSYILWEIGPFNPRLSVDSVMVDVYNSFIIHQHIATSWRYYKEVVFQY